MIWLRPWAWLGAATILLPILIHLLGRGQRITHRFPSLRFIDPSRLLPAQRNRLQDLLLLLVRVAVLLLAVIALAQPRMRGQEEQGATGGGVTRAIVIDTSVSMGRLTAAGVPGHRAAGEAADQLAREAAISRRFLTATPAAAIGGAASWLAQQSGPRELVVISDFQLGAVDSNAIASVNPSLAVRLVPILVTHAATSEFVSAQDGNLITATVATDPISSTVSWRRSATGAPPAPLRWLVGPTETALAAASLRAANSIGVPPASTSSDSVLLVFPNAPERALLRAKATSLRAAWMIALVARLRETRLLDQLAPISGGNGDSLLAAVWSASGSAPVAAAADGNRLLLFVDAPVASPFSAALAATVLRLTARTTPAGESEPLAIDSVRLATWQRGPSGAGVASEPTAESSSGRWFWAAALLMLGVETWMRRRVPSAVEVPNVVG
jgi:hypothetical protein